MFKKLLSDNRIFGGIVCVLVFIAGGLLYWQFVQRQASRDIQRTQDILEQRDTPQTGKAEPQTDTGGHFHADGTWHAEPHTPATPKPAPPSAVTAQTQDAPPPQTREAAAGVSRDFSAAYQALRAKYPEQTKNPHPLENVPVDLWDFEATKTAFMDHFNFYVEQGGYKPEVFESNREVRIAFAIMENIHNAAEPWFGLFTPEQCEEIDVMYKRYHEFEDVKPLNITRLRELINEGYSISDAHEKTMKEAGYR